MVSFLSLGFMVSAFLLNYVLRTNHMGKCIIVLYVIHVLHNTVEGIGNISCSSHLVRKVLPLLGRSL